MGRRFLRVLHATLHAATDVEQHGDTDARFLVTELGDVPRHAAILNLEILGSQIRDEAAFLVAHHGVNPYEVDAGLEGRDRPLAGNRGLPQRSGADAEAAN